MGECDLLLPNEIKQGVRRIFSRIDLLHSKRRRDVGDAPCMNMKHRGDRHIDVVGIETPMPCARESAHTAEGVQDELPMSEVHALRQPGGARRIERRGAGV